MRVLITGGSGFLGARLARELLGSGMPRPAADPRPVSRLTLADAVEPPADLRRHERVRVVTGDLLATLGGALAGEVAGADVVFHLAAAVSAECERDFDLGMRANVQTTLQLLEAVRAAGHRPVVVFASSLAVYGAVPVVDDTTLPLPGSSYGTQKLVCEHLLREYTRRGFLRGRSARLMTVTVRPGRPNAAASGFLSAIIREPLAGRATACPVPPQTLVALCSPRAAVAGLIRVAVIADAPWGDRLGLNLPALTVPVSEMVAALGRVAGEPVAQRVSWAEDPAVRAIVGGWPARFDPGAARSFGLEPEPDMESIIRAYLREAAG
jgi:D-erythronate 2-dehydrogenase